MHPCRPLVLALALVAGASVANARVIRLQAEDIKFNAGVASYYDTTAGNAGGQRHPSLGIDIASYATGEFYVYNIALNEWIDYWVPGDGTAYTPTIRYGGTSAGQLRLELNGSVVGTINLPATGGSTTWATVSGPSFTIPSGGLQTLRWTCTTTGFTLDYIDLDNGAANPPVQQADAFDYPFSPASAWSTSGDFTQYYNSTYHPGDDQNTGSGGNSDWGAPLLAMGNGEVVFADYRTDAWGNIVMIAHTLPDGSTVWSQMAHCEQMFVQAGDRVSKGQYIGVVGAGANDTYISHLHFEIRKKYRDAWAWVNSWSIAQEEEWYWNPTNIPINVYTPVAFIEGHLDARSIVKNGNMELDFVSGVQANWTSWASLGTPTFNRATANRHDGSYSQYWARTDTAAFVGGVYQVIPTTPGTTYDISARLKRQSSLAGTALKFGYDLSGGTSGTAGSVVYTDLTAGGDNAWLPYTASITATGNNVTLFAQGGHTGTTGGSNAYFYLDFVKFIPTSVGPTPTPSPSPSPSPSPTPSPSPSPTPTPTPTPSPSPSPTPTPSNVVSNGSFETWTGGTIVATDWTSFTNSGTPTFGRASANKVDGSYSQYWARTDTAAFEGGVYQQVPVTQGRIYSLAASMKRQSVFTGTGMSFGYDITGGTSATASSVVWTDLTGTNNVWNALPATSIASTYGGYITLFAKGGHSSTSGDVNAYFYVDAVSMLDAGASTINGSMESGASTGVRDNWTGWTKSGSNAITFGRASANKYDGSYSQYMARTDALTFTGAVYQQVAVTSGQSYRLRGWMKKQSTSSAGSTMKFGYDPNGGTNPDAGSCVYTNLTTHDAWVGYDQSFTATGPTITVIGYCDQVSGSNSYYYVDGVSLTKN